MPVLRCPPGRPLSFPNPPSVFPHEAQDSECALNGFSLGLFKAKTALRPRLHWTLWQTARRRRSIAETSGRASSSPSPTRPALGALPPSQARPPTSSCLASSKGKSRCAPPSPGVSAPPTLVPLHYTLGKSVLDVFSWPCSGGPAGSKPSKVPALGNFHFGGGDRQ